MMMFLNLRFILFYIFMFLHWAGNAQLHIVVNKIPENTPQGAPIYIAGTFNGWNPGNELFRLQPDSSGNYRITLNPAVGTIRFKFTRGSWQKVEGNATGGFIPDRTVTYSGQAKTEFLSIAGWEDLGQPGSGSTASPQVSILSENFFIPQLNRSRKIWLYLPPDYHSSQKHYPVLYMHDGQNLFDRQTAFAGEWKVDESLDSLFNLGDHGCIVVGIENGGSQRLNEYSPWVNPQYGGGQGDAYISFIISTLKPYVDSVYRSLPEPEFTGIMGSSMGGLISLYASIKYPDVFGKTGALSSSFWFSPNSYTYVSDTGAEEGSYIYMIAGGQEGGNQIKDMEKMQETLINAGLPSSNVISVPHPDGAHSEWYWSREFPKVYQWLFEKKTSGVIEPEKSEKITFRIKYSELLIAGYAIDPASRLSVADIQGRIRLSLPVKENQIDISSLDAGIYIVTLHSNNTVIASGKIVVIK
jgi:predicted alpha/beta superfamily hydrolase